jgi:hypothetical protein
MLIPLTACDDSYLDAASCYLQHRRAGIQYPQDRRECSIVLPSCGSGNSKSDLWVYTDIAYCPLISTSITTN